MAAVHTLEEKLEGAAKAVFEGLADFPAGLSVHRAFDNDEITEASLLIAAQDEGVPPDEENIEPTGNRRLSLGVQVRTPSDYGREEHNDAAGVFKDTIFTDDLAARLSAEVADFTAFYCRPVDVVRNATDQHFTSIITVEVWAAPM